MPARDSASAREWTTAAETAAGQALVYSGRFAEANLYFGDLAQRFPLDPVGPVLAAGALIWEGNALEEDGYLADSIDALLSEAESRAARAVEAAPTDSARVVALFWLGTATGYRARQGELLGKIWRAVGDAGRMRHALQEARSLDSTCVDCLLGLAIYDYALARAGALKRFVAHLLGLGGGDARVALEWLRRVSEQGTVTRVEGEWVYANALLREYDAHRAGAEGGREEARRLVGDLVARFPDNPVFRRFLERTAPAP